MYPVSGKTGSSESTCHSTIQISKRSSLTHSKLNAFKISRKAKRDGEFKRSQAINRRRKIESRIKVGSL
jgi:hypothetical protein